MATTRPMPAPDAQPDLVADIGGTNTRVALAFGGVVDHASIRRYKNAENADLPSILRHYLDEMGFASCAGACLAVAGPIKKGLAEMTNLNWRITDTEVANATGAGRVAFINDLQAQGHALDRLRPGTLREIAGGTAEAAGGARLVIGCGTGFNSAPVHKTRAGLYVAPAECGHVTLAVRDDEELRLATYLEQEHGFASAEDVLAGRGLERLFAFLAIEAGRPETPAAAEIMRRIGEGTDPVANRTCDLYLTILGRTLGDLALIHLPFGGIYLIGGVARAFAPYMAERGFLSAFRDKGRFAEFMEQFSISLIEDDFAALEGCSDHLQSLAHD